MKHRNDISVTLTPQSSTGLRFMAAPVQKLTLWARFARWSCQFGHSNVSRDTRREAGIQCLVGSNGSGKTLRMVEDIEPELNGIRWECYQEDHHHNDPQYDDAGEFTGFGPLAHHEGMVRILSTVRLLDPETGHLHPRYEKFDDWQLLEHLEHAVLLLDEITGVAHSRDGASLPHNIMHLIQMMRKGDVRIIWTAPDWDRAEKLIREVTTLVTICQGDLPDRQAGGLWLPNRRFLYRSYDTRAFDEWSAAKAGTLKPAVRQYVWGPGSIGFRLYNTKQKVTSIGHSNDAGVCVQCGGVRRRQECSCHDYQAHKAAARPSRVPRAGARGILPAFEESAGAPLD